MKSKRSSFGKRTSYQESGDTRKVIKDFFGILLIIVFVVLVIALLRSPGFEPEATAVSLMGMLGDPFRTTRQMKVPYKSRIGHRERAYRSFAKFAVMICAGTLLLAFFFRIMKELGW